MKETASSGPFHGIFSRFTGARPRGGSAQNIFSALHIRNYRLFFTGQIISVTGTFMQSTAQQWLVLKLTPNPLALGVVGALQFGPLLLLGPFGGAIADRWPRRKVLMFTQASAGLLSAIMLFLTATNLVALWHVFALALILGVINAVDMPTRQAFVSEMVPQDKLLNAVSLNSAQFNAARILGPGLAGGLIALIGVPPLFLIDVLSYIAVITGLVLMNASELYSVAHASMGHGLVGRLQAIGEGARYVVSKPRLRVTFLLVAVIGTFGFNFNVLLPLEATDVLHAGPAAFGLISSALGAGALAGALALAGRQGAPTNRWLAGMGIAFGILESLVAISPSLPLTLLIIALTGFAMSSFGASANTRTQLSSPPEIRGRVMSVYTMVFMGTTPIGNLAISAVAGAVSVPVGFLVAGVPSLLASLGAVWLWHRQDAAEQAPSAHRSWFHLHAAPSAPANHVEVAD